MKRSSAFPSSSELETSWKYLKYLLFWCIRALFYCLSEISNHLQVKKRQWIQIKVDIASSTNSEDKLITLPRSLKYFLSFQSSFRMGLLFCLGVFCFFCLRFFWGLIVGHFCLFGWLVSFLVLFLWYFSSSYCISAGFSFLKTPWKIPNKRINLSRKLIYCTASSCL